jgi:4-hydroxy-3-polyprenylbenzoate decarboxylase
MGYRNLAECARDLEQSGQLVRIKEEVDPYLEAAAIQRRAYQAQGPALLFENVKGCRFPLLANLFGTIERTRFLFRDTLESVRRLIELKIDPDVARKQPLRYAGVLRTMWTMQPRRVRSGPVLANQTTIDQLPQLQCWPKDGGAFITLPAVYTEDVEHSGFARSNLGMYRVQLSGGRYDRGREVGLHYQIHRGIGVHHAAALRSGQPFRVNVMVGGPPALILSAVMPLPESLSELMFAGALGGRRVRMIARPGQLPFAAEADFCITGVVDPNKLLPEGPFGDHLGYYSLAHDFPVLKVDAVYYRDGAIWPFTSVGRPPQEDTSFGRFIHELTGPIIPTVVHGVHAVHAVDAAGVHPLLLAIGSERYVPYAQERKPMEILTCANALLGQGQLSLAKYLLIVAKEDDPALDIHDVAHFLQHVLERADWSTDVHFQTCTTIDTLDYSGSALNAGSKVVIAAAGAPRRALPTTAPVDLRLPAGFGDPRLVMPGVLVLRAPPFSGLPHDSDSAVRRFCELCGAAGHPVRNFPLVVLVDDSDFTARTLGNFLWVTFTRSNPATDIDGVDAFVAHKHWGCRDTLVIDARTKPHHAPPLEEDPQVTKRVDALAAPGGPLHGII